LQKPLDKHRSIYRVYRVKKPGDTGIRHGGPATIRLANPVLAGPPSMIKLG
jgi:hypothetical protein